MIDDSAISANESSIAVSLAQGTRAPSLPCMLEDDDRPPRGQRRSRDLDRAGPRPLDRVAGQHLQEPFQRLDVEVDLGRLVVHRHDDPRSDGVEQSGDLGKVDRRRAAGGRQDDVGPAQRRQLGFGERVAEVAQEDEVQVLGAEMDDRHFVFGQALGRLENMDRLEPDAADDLALGRQLERPDRLERRDDLAEMAVVAVVLVADDDQVGRLGDRLVSPRVRANGTGRG